VNVICDTALLLAYAGRDTAVKGAHIRQALRDLDLREPGRTNGEAVNGSARPAIQTNGTAHPQKQNGHAPAATQARPVAARDNGFWHED